MSEKAKDTITGAIITAWTFISINILILNPLYEKIPNILFVGIIISYTALFTLIVLHLWKAEYFEGLKKILLFYSLPVTIFFLSVIVNEIFKPPISKFTDEEFGILVANFKGEIEETKKQGKEIKNTIISNLEEDFETQKSETNVRIMPLNEAITPKTGEARLWGEKYNADIVLYGRITGGKGEKAQIFPWLTIVDSIITKEIHRTDICMGKYHFGWDEIELPSSIIDNPKTLYTLTEALMYQSNKEFKKAEQKLKSISGIINNLDTLAIRHHFLGNLYLSQVIDTTLKDVDRDYLLELAEREYIKSITKDSTYHNSNFALGYLYAAEKKRSDLAISYFERARNQQKENYKYNYNLAQVYIDTDQTEKADKIISKYLNDNPKIESDKKNEMQNLLEEIKRKRYKR